MKTTKLTKEQMMENIARKFGLENKWVIAFCSVCECGLYSDELIEMIYNWKMENGDNEGEDE